jgi:hypothetical protein
METARFYVFFLVCYYFTKKAVKLLTLVSPRGSSNQPED